jgi:hypothetical protein
VTAEQGRRNVLGRKVVLGRNVVVDDVVGVVEVDVLVVVVDLGSI